LISTRWKTPLLLGVVTSPLFLAGCSQTSHSMSVASLTNAITPSFLSSRSYRYTPKDRECLERAMFFESNRSSRDGMVAVGTVVMNRLKSGEHGNTICEVVGESGQFAPGVMTRPLNSRALPDVKEAADAVLRGERKAKLKNTMYFHTAGLRFPYRNMHYTMLAGGNAFYERRGRHWKPLPDDSEVAVASATPLAPAPVARVTPATRVTPPAPVTLVASAAPAWPANAALAKTVPAKTIYATAAAWQSARSTRVTSIQPTSIKASALDARPLNAAGAKATTLESTHVGTTLVAMQQPMQEPMEEPDASRFGGTADTRPVTSFPIAPAESTTMAFESTPENTDAIGAMIASQSRPLQE
jgi:spore germination cell wall hydrolase CwlJ-like protein